MTLGPVDFQLIRVGTLEPVDFRIGPEPWNLSTSGPFWARTLEPVDPDSSQRMTLEPLDFRPIWSSTLGPVDLRIGPEPWNLRASRPFGP